VLGLPALSGLLLTGYRSRLPRVWRSWRLVLVVSLGANLLWQSVQLVQTDLLSSPLPLLFTLFDLLALLWLLISVRLRACFLPPHDPE